MSYHFNDTIESLQWCILFTYVKRLNHLSDTMKISVRLILNFYIFCYTYSRGINSVFRKWIFRYWRWVGVLGLDWVGQGVKGWKEDFWPPFTWESWKSVFCGMVTGVNATFRVWFVLVAYSIVFITLFQRTFPVSVPTDFQIKDATPTI